MQSRLSERDGHVALTIPPAGLSAGRGLRAAALGVGAVVLLVLALRASLRGGSLVSGYVAALCALALLGVAAYLFCYALLDTTRVRISRDAVEVTHSFPFKRVGTVGRRELQGVAIGRPRLVARGYSSPGWARGRCEVVVWGEGRALHFGLGLQHDEQRWLKELIETTLGFEEPLPAEVAEEAEAGIIQPPERLWSDVSRYGACCTAGGIALLALLVLAGADPPSLASAFILVLFTAAVGVLGYRNYRLERVASGWHRAVVKFLAAKRGLRFSAVDRADVGGQLPDFDFLGGPRLLYNIAWSDTDLQEMIAFDFSSRGFGALRDGVGCALRVDGLSGDTISIRRRRFGGCFWRWAGLKLADYPDLVRRYCVRVENEGRARRLLGPAVVDAILRWPGRGPPPWVCLTGGMVGVCMPRRHATNDRAVRVLYDHARNVRRAVEERLRHLRTEPGGSGSGVHSI